MLRISVLFFVLLTCDYAFADILMFLPNGSYKKLASISDANSSAEAQGKTIIVTSLEKINEDTVLSNDRVWRFEFGGGIEQGRYSLVINGIVDSGPYQIFSGIGKLKFGYGSIRKVLPEWFGARGDGKTDCTMSFQKAAESLKTTGGGIIEISGASKYYLASRLEIGPRVSVKGPHDFIGSPGNNSSANYGENGGALLVSSKATIVLKSGSGLSGLLIYRSNMSFPAVDSSAFAGTAITCGGDDIFVSKCMILGFNKAFYSNGFQRPRIDYLWGDNNSGIEIVNCLDIPYISNCHMWPFATIASSPKRDKWADRPGPAYFIHDTVDWAKFLNCFSYGYSEGFTVLNANSATLISCGVDGTKKMQGTIGFNIRGTSTDTKLIACQAAAQDTGYLIDTGPGRTTILDSCSAWGNSVGLNSRHVSVQVGDLVINGGIFRDGITSIVVHNHQSRVMVNNARFVKNKFNSIYNLSKSNYVFENGNDYID
mgnify:CR=1 FL=1